MFNIAGRIFVSIQIDGNDLPHSPNLIERIIMTEGMGALSPAIELILNDYAGSLSKELALTDGNELVVTVGKTPQDVKVQSRQYRVFGMRSVTTPTGPRMQIVGLYDAPGYLTGSVRESFKSTTGEALASIAQRCKLKYIGPESINGRKTDDSQVWMNIAKSRAMFVHQTTRHGYIDEHSAMFSVLTSLGELRYFDMNEVIATPKEKIKYHFVHNTYPVVEGSDNILYIVHEAKTRSSAGLMNTWHNYGSTRIEHNLNGEKITHEKVEVKTTAEYLPINNTVKKTVDRSRLDYSPLDCGNTHKNFNKAQYQNLKLLSLFTEHVSLLVDVVTDVQLLDVVIYRQANADPKVPVSNSDIYLVIGKSIVTQSGNYVERLELVRHNITEKGATELATEDSSNTMSSSTPESTIDPTSNIGVDSLPKTAALAAIMAPAQNSLNAAKGSLPDLRRAGQFAVPSTKGSLSALRELRNGVKDARRLVSEVKGTIGALKHYGDIGKQFTSQLKSSVDNVKGFANSIQNYPQSLRNAAMFSKSGLVSTYTSSLSGVKNQLQMSAMLRPMKAELERNRDLIRSVSGGEAIINEFKWEADRIENNAKDASRYASTMWNSTLSVMNGKSIPKNERIARANAKKMTNVLSNLYRQPISRSYVTVPLSTATVDIANAMTEKGTDRQPNWIPDDVDYDYDSSFTKQRIQYEASEVNYDEDLQAAEKALFDMESEDEAMQFREGDYF